MSKRAQYTPATGPAGFTVVECLIGLAISAVLLAAVAAAFNASVINYQENEKIYETINNARQALVRMTSQLRTAGYFDGPVWHGVAHNASPGPQCIFYTPDQELTTYEFRDATYANAACRNKLYLITNGNEYVLCDNVTDATFTTTTDNGHDATGVQMSLTVRSGDFQRTLAAAAVVRRIVPQ